MKILLAGSASSVFLKELIEYVLVDQTFEIYLLDDGNIPSEYLDFYMSKKVYLIPTNPSGRLIQKIPKLRGIWKNFLLARRLKGEGPFDVIWMHYVTMGRYSIIRPLIQNHTKFFFSFWGSDILRTSTKDFLKLKSCFELCQAYTTSVDKMDEIIDRHFGSKYDEKKRRALFGIGAYDSIDKIEQNEGVEKCREYFDIPLSATVLTIGYNKYEAQQHDCILTELSSLAPELLKDVVVVLPFAYGQCSCEYENNIKQLALKLPAKVMILTKYLTREEVARLRIASDIYVNAQVTDAFSASVQEYLYAGNVLLNPKWLKYPEFDQLKVEYIQYRDFSEMQMELVKLLSRKPIQRQTTGKRLRKVSSWDVNRSGWTSLIELFSDKKVGDTAK